MDGLTIEALLTAAPEAAEAPADEAGSAESTEKRKPQSARLVELAADAMLFATPDGDPYADVAAAGHRETYPLRDRRFREWLAHRHYLTEGRTPTSNAMQDALSVLEGRARFEGVKREVFVRVAHADGAMFLDLGREDWSAVEVTSAGWRVIAEPPVRFWRPNGQFALPVPVEGGELGELWQVLNINEAERALVLAWLVMLFHPRGPYPVLVLRGEQGSAKTSASEIIKGLVDPTKAALRPEPREVRDLMIAATNARVLGFDNLSSIAPWLSDALCRLATGGGFSVRAHYENAAETLFEATRPILINGISDVATRSDLIDRCIFASTVMISESTRRTKADVTAAWEEMHPRVLGALLTAVATAIKNEPHVRLDHLPRMADFATWAAAAEPGLGVEPGTVARAFAINRADAHGIVLDASPVGAAVLRLAERDQRWIGTPDELHKLLGILTPDAARGAFPKNAKALSDVLRRIAPNLRAVGVNVEHGRSHGARMWRVEKARFLAAPAAPDDLNASNDAERPGAARVPQGAASPPTGAAPMQARVPQVPQGAAPEKSCGTPESKSSPALWVAGAAGAAPNPSDSLDVEDFPA